MSEAKKEKVQMDPKYILKLAGVLMLISAIVAGLLGLVNGVTWEKIAEIQAQKLQASLQAVFPDATFTEIPVTDELVAIADQEDAESGLSAIYESSTGGYAIEVLPTGFNGFLADRLALELSYEKTLVTHTEKPAKFLGYEVTVRKSNLQKRNKRGSLSRVYGNKVRLKVTTEVA